MSNKPKNKNLQKAKNTKNDEFYTQLSDIEKELKHYKNQLKDKIIYCNCDNPEWSNFWKYFKDNFEELGIKELVATYYEEDKITYKTIYDGKETNKIKLNGNGDFRSSECIEILKTSDIVITNPPFSLFREYIAQLMEYDKQFLVLGNMNAITYKEIFPLLKDNKIWLGLTNPKEFKTPNGTIQKFGNIGWYTNIDHEKRHIMIPLDLGHKYYGYENQYPKYDNYDAINVDKISNIPCDYTGVVGVPISYMDKYCPEQFEIIKFRKGNDGKDLRIEGKCPYFRILIKKIS